jgi:hypothetical protein
VVVCPLDAPAPKAITRTTKIGTSCLDRILITDDRTSRFWVTLTPESGPLENIVGSNSTPHDVCFARPNLVSVGKRSSSIGRKRHLVDAGRSLDTLHPKASTEGSIFGAEIVDELGDGVNERSPLLGGHRQKVRTKSREPRVCRHLA